MTSMQSTIIELAQGANQVLLSARKMAIRGDSRVEIERYLTNCRDCLLNACSEVARFLPSQLLDDIVRALRYARPNAELLGTLAVLTGVDDQDASTNFRSFSLTAGQKVRAEIRDHGRWGVCDVTDIKLGAELALRSLQPLVAA